MYDNDNNRNTYNYQQQQQQPQQQQHSNNYSQQRQSSYEEHRRRSCTPPPQPQQQPSFDSAEQAPCTPPRRQPTHSRDVCRASSPPPVTQRVYQRLPTPEPDVHEQVIVRPAPQQYIERIIERPRTPSPIVRTREVSEAPKPPIYTCRVVDVERRPRMRRQLSQTCLDGYERSHSRAYSQHQIPPAPTNHQPEFYSSNQSLYNEQQQCQQQPQFHYTSQQSLTGNGGYYDSNNTSQVDLNVQCCTPVSPQHHQFDLHQPGGIPLFITQPQSSQQTYCSNPVCMPGSQQKKKKGFLGCFRGKKGSSNGRGGKMSIDEKSCVPLY